MTIIREAFVNEGAAAHSERAIRLFAKATRCSTFDVRGIQETTGTCTFNERGMSLDAIARVIPKLRHRNASGSGVFIRPCHPFALAGDVEPGTIDRMLDDDLRIAAVIETSPGSHQAWIPLAGSLQTVDAALCVAACEQLVELYGTDPGVAHRDSFGRAPGFRNRKPEHDHGGTTPLVVMSNRHSGFRGYDRSLLEEARRMIANHPQHLGKRSAGAVLTDQAHATSAISDDLGPIEVWQGDDHVVTFSAISTEHLFRRWLTDMVRSGYVLPQRSNRVSVDRSQRDLDVLRSMHNAGVARHIARAALEACSDKAREHREPYVRRLLSAVWEANDLAPSKAQH